MFRIILLVLFLALTLSGCAKRIVYLSKTDVSQNDIEQITQQLQQRDYLVELIDAKLPEQYDSSMLIKNPHFNDKSYLETILRILESVGYADIAVSQLGQQNHYYKTQNVGIYLRLEPKRNGLELPPIMRSERCGTGYATIEFLPQNQVLFEYEARNELGQLEDRQIRGGYSLEQGAHGNMMLNSSPFGFNFWETTAQTYLGEKRAIKLRMLKSPVTQIVDDCTYITIFE